MNNRKSKQAELETKIVKLGQTIDGLKTKQEIHRENAPDFDIHATASKHEKARAKADELEYADEDSWWKIFADIEGLLEDIDQDLRQALAYLGG